MAWSGRWELPLNPNNRVHLHMGIKCSAAIRLASNGEDLCITHVDEVNDPGVLVTSSFTPLVQNKAACLSLLLTGPSTPGITSQEASQGDLRKTVDFQDSSSCNLVDSKETFQTITGIGHLRGHPCNVALSRFTCQRLEHCSKDTVTHLQVRQLQPALLTGLAIVTGTRFACQQPKCGAACLSMWLL